MHRHVPSRYFGVDNVRQAVRRINKMAQRELQVCWFWQPAGRGREFSMRWRGCNHLNFPLAPSSVQEMFQRVYGVRSSSNNNLWLRKKLIEAVNTRPRERASRTSSAQLPASVAHAPAAGFAGAPASADVGMGTLRRRRKKSSVPMRASDGVQVGQTCQLSAAATFCRG